MARESKAPVKETAPVENEQVYTAEEFKENEVYFAKKLATTVDIITAAMAEKKMVSATVSEFEAVVKEFKERKVK